MVQATGDVGSNVSGNAVCVVIPAYNAQATIGRAVRSALAQDHVAEVIVCDDASQDDTADAARREDDGTGRLTVITLARNAGPAAARNAALAASRSPYVCLLDSDDYFLPGRIAGLLDAAAGEWDFLADDIVIVPETLVPEILSAPPALPRPGAARRSMILDLTGFVRENISRAGRPRRELGFLKPLMRRAFLDEHGLRYDEGIRLGEDYALYVRALLAGARFRVVPACGYVAIERSASLSGRHTAQDLERIAEFDSRCLAEAALTADEREALAAHRHASRQKSDHRTLLEIRRKQGLLPAAAELLGMKGSRYYIVAETLSAKAGALMSRLGLKPQSNGRIRLLIGPPLSAPIDSAAGRSGSHPMPGTLAGQRKAAPTHPFETR